MRVATAVLMTFSLAGGSFARPVPSPPSAALASNTDSKATLFGATLDLPAGWTIEREGAFATIRPPETGLQIRVTRFDNMTDPAKAVAAAWKITKPDFSYPLASRSARGPVRGWDDYIVFNYDAPASEGRTAVAAAYRSGTRWTVLTADVSLAVVERRGAELGQLVGSVSPEGYVAEDLAGRVPRPLDAARLGELRTFVTEGMKKLRIPGAAMAVIVGDRIVVEEGLGVRTYGRPEPVDAHTRFMIASNTKGMTTLLLARLVGEGKLRWDQPVNAWWPAVKLADPVATRKLEVRHLVCACTGLPRADYETYFVDPGASASLALGQLALLKPTTDFGSTFQYSNTLAAVAGFVAGHAAYPKMEPAQAYDRAMRELVWAPLGMTETSFDDPRYVRGNFAAPHGDTLDGGIGFAPQGLNATVLPYRPAGSAWSSAHDMALYVRNEIAAGKLPDGRQWVDRDALLVRRERGVSVGKDSWYGMGLETNVVGGIGTVFHGGAVNGYKSDWIVVPDARIGAVLLVNGENGYPLVTAFRRKVIELLYNAKPEAQSMLDGEAQRIEEALASQRVAIDPAVPSKDILAARYVNPVLGRITVRREGARVTFDFGPWATDIGIKRDPHALGGFDFVSIAPSDIDDLAFVPGRDGKVRTLTLRDNQHVYVYREEANEAP